MIDPQARKFLDDFYRQNLPPVETLPLETLRRIFEDKFYYEDHAPIKEIRQQQVPGPLGPIPLKIYFPTTPGPHPVFISIHGGGWIAGSLRTNDALSREICSQTQSIVVSVGYHRSPEHKFPGPLNDCFTAATWVFRHIKQFGGDPHRVAIGGDSAGGNLAAAVTLMMKKQIRHPFYAQVLLYPVTNHSFDTFSYHQCAEGYLLRREAMKWYWGRYLAHESDGTNPLASPLQAPDVTHLPPTLFIQADYDPLRDDGLAYSERLKAAGVSTEVRCYNTIHGFVEFAGIFDLGKKALEDISTFLKKQQEIH